MIRLFHARQFRTRYETAVRSQDPAGNRWPSEWDIAHFRAYIKEARELGSTCPEVHGTCPAFGSFQSLLRELGELETKIARANPAHELHESTAPHESRSVLLRHWRDTLQEVSRLLEGMYPVSGRLVDREFMVALREARHMHEADPEHKAKWGGIRGKGGAESCCHCDSYKPDIGKFQSSAYGHAPAPAAEAIVRDGNRWRKKGTWAAAAAAKKRTSLLDPEFRKMRGSYALRRERVNVCLTDPAIPGCLWTYFTGGCCCASLWDIAVDDPPSVLGHRVERPSWDTAANTEDAGMGICDRLCHAPLCMKGHAERSLSHSLVDPETGKWADPELSADEATRLGLGDCCCYCCTAPRPTTKRPWTRALASVLACCFDPLGAGVCPETCCLPPMGAVAAPKIDAVCASCVLDPGWLWEHALTRRYTHLLGDEWKDVLQREGRVIATFEQADRAADYQKWREDCGTATPAAGSPQDEKAGWQRLEADRFACEERLATAKQALSEGGAW